MISDAAQVYATTLDQSIAELAKIKITIAENRMTIENLNDGIFTADRQLICETFSRFVGKEIQVLTFKNCSLLQSNFVTLIEPFKDLTQIGFAMSSCTDQKSVDDTKILSLEKLENFNMFATSPFNTETLKLTTHILAGVHTLISLNLNMEVAVIEDGSDPYEELREIVSRQEKLEIISISDSNFFSRPLINPKFQLESFRLIDSKNSNGNFTTEQSQNLKAFLSTQTDVLLVDCDIARQFHLPSIHKMKDNWKTMTMHEVHLKFDLMTPSSYIKDYCMDFQKFAGGKNEFDELVKMISVKYPNIEILGIALFGLKHSVRTCDDILETMKGFKHLKELTICDCYSFLQVGRMKVPNLQSIEVWFDSANHNRRLLHSQEDQLDLIHNPLLDFNFDKLTRFIAKHTELVSIKIVIWDPSFLDTGAIPFFVEFCLQALKKLKTVAIRFLDDVLTFNPTLSADLQETIDRLSSPGFKFIVKFENLPEEVYEKI